MIKAAVSGADTPIAGELLRILVNHPEVEIVSISAPGKEGVSALSVHHGLIGEAPLFFSTRRAATSKCDILFVGGPEMSAAELYALKLARPELKIVLLSPMPELDESAAGFVFGLPEINRKLLVRGSTAAYVPAAPASAVLVPLYPLACHMLVNASLRIEVTAPDDIIALHAAAAAIQIENTLSEVQLSFRGMPRINFKPSGNDRLMTADITMECGVDMPNIAEIFEMYDDHNFAFPVLSDAVPKETAGTEKCVFSIRKTDDRNLCIRSVADPRMRGGAGEAVHIMNLLFGLHEKTGLSLKASEF